MVRHCQIRTIELQHKPGLYDRLVFLLHRRSDGFDIGFVARIIGIGLKHRDEAGRGGGHKSLDGRDLVERRAQIGEVLVQRLTVAPGDWPDAHRTPSDVRTGHPLQRGEEVRVVLGVEPRLGRLMPGKARKAVGDIGRIAGLRHFAVIDDVDADRSLAADDVEHGLTHHPVEFALIKGFALILAHQHLPQFGRPRQAADMGRQDTVLARLHCFPPVLDFDRGSMRRFVTIGNRERSGAVRAPSAGERLCQSRRRVDACNYNG